VVVAVGALFAWIYLPARARGQVETGAPADEPSQQGTHS
jgi:hypothetical protein